MSQLCQLSLYLFIFRLFIKVVRVVLKKYYNLSYHYYWFLGD